MKPSRMRAWLFTFADLSALLLAFFVLAYSMTALDREAWHRVSEGLARGTADGPYALGPAGPDLTAAGPGDDGAGRPRYLAGALVRGLEEAGHPCGLSAEIRPGELRVSLGSSVTAGGHGVCREALRQVARIVGRLVSTHPQLAVLDLPVPAGAEIAAVLTAAERMAKISTTLLGLAAPVVAVPAGVDEDVPVLRVGLLS